MSDKDPRDLWRDIVRLTDASGNDCIRSLRIALFILLRNNATEPLLRQLHKLLLSARHLLPAHRRSLARATRGSLLFYFPHRTPSNIQNLLPVAREAYRRNLLFGIVSASDYSTELAEFEGLVPIETTDNVISQIGIRERWRIAGAAARIRRRVSKMIAEYDARLSWRLQRSAGTLLWETMRSLLVARSLPVLLDAWVPRCIVSTSDLWPVECQVAQEASKKKIVSIVIQHGNLIYYYWPFTASTYIVWGQESFEEMLSLGAPANRVAIGGMPASDRMLRVSNASDDVKRGHIERPTCLILSQSGFRSQEPEMFRQYGRFLSELILSIPWVHWKVKLHPSENRDFYDELGSGVASRLEFCPRPMALIDAFRGADVVTTLFSTAGLEAMLADYPLIIPIVSPRMMEPGFPQIKGGLIVRTPAEFESELQSLVSNSEYRAGRMAAQRQALNRGFAHQGHSSEAIMDMIQSLGLVNSARGDDQVPPQGTEIASSNDLAVGVRDRSGRSRNNFFTSIEGHKVAFLRRMHYWPTRDGAGTILGRPLRHVSSVSSRPRSAGKQHEGSLY